MVNKLHPFKFRFFNVIHHRFELTANKTTDYALSVGLRKDGYKVVLEGLVVDDLSFCMGPIFSRELSSYSCVSKCNTERLEHGDIHQSDYSISNQHHG